MKVYLLYHKRCIEDEVYNLKNIGIYSSLEKCEDVVRRYFQLPGFADYPDGFHTEEFYVPEKSVKFFSRGKDVLFFLQYEDPDDPYERVEKIGVYHSRFALKKALQKFRKEARRNGKEYSRRGFSIDTYSLDEDNWCEGFVVIE